MTKADPQFCLKEEDAEADEMWDMVKALEFPNKREKSSPLNHIEPIELRTGPLWPANPQEAQQQQRRLFVVVCLTPMILLVTTYVALCCLMLPGAFARSVCVGHSTTVEFQLIDFFPS